MPTSFIWLIAALAAAAAVFIILMMLPQSWVSPGDASGGGSVIPAAPPGSVVTVRKVGGVTSVVIREGISDHWEGGGVPAPVLPPEVTRLHCPEQYAEYMSDRTPAGRKYELIEEVYAMGFTLPYQRGLNEQYKRELQEALSGADPDARTIHERTPVNLTAARGGGGEARLDIDEGLRSAPVPDLGPEEPEGHSHEVTSNNHKTTMP